MAWFLDGFAMFSIFVSNLVKTMAVKEKLEFDILNAYLPAMMNEGEIRKLVQSVIIETNAKALSDIGKVMPIIMQKGGSKIDGKIANQILRELLE